MHCMTLPDFRIMAPVRNRKLKCSSKIMPNRVLSAIFVGCVVPFPAVWIHSSTSPAFGDRKTLISFVFACRRRKMPRFGRMCGSIPSNPCHGSFVIIICSGLKAWHMSSSAYEPGKHDTGWSTPTFVMVEGFRGMDANPGPSLIKAWDRSWVLQHTKFQSSFHQFQSYLTQNAS